MIRNNRKGEEQNGAERNGKILNNDESLRRPAKMSISLRPACSFAWLVVIFFFFNEKFNHNASSSLSSLSLSLSVNNTTAPAAVVVSTETTTTTDTFGTSYSRPIHPILKKSLAKVSGDGWNLDPNSILKSEMAKTNNLQCNWIDFVSTKGIQAKFCGHSGGDLVTRGIIKKKRWRDCDIIPKLWDRLEKDDNSVYIEIGANIGSCVMEMLLSTDAKIIAFEPHPVNQFVLQNTIQALSPNYQERFLLVPVALGSETSRNEIYATKRNMGNSVVGKVIKDYFKQQDSEFEKYDIAVERISSIINAGEKGDNNVINIPLIKMDAQGFECKILGGLDQNLANRIHEVKLEVAGKWLKGQNCNDLFRRFRQMGFELQSQDGKEVYAKGDSEQFGGKIIDILAVKKTN
mmetsp:Transcript_5052/g.5865  ORF Transcript_5052/g.5865 Transcript_5052/m.5865 type:complete len:404 (-) Transcript_5052:247-1458(-)